MVFGGILLLLVLHWQFVYADLYRYGSFMASKTWLFDLDREQNLSTLISSVFFLTAAYWSMRLARQARRHIQTLGWYIFALFFTYLAFDEMFIVHEQLAEPLRRVLDISGSSPFFHAWVIPALAVAIFLGVALMTIRHWKNLKVFANILVLVIILVVGTVACEIFGTFVYNNTAVYRFAMVPTEEIFELSMGAILWLSLRNKYRALAKRK